MNARSYQLKPKPVEAVQFNATLGWGHALEVAEWCGGVAWRDEMPQNIDKTYYWSIAIPGGRAYSGDWIVRDEHGDLATMSADGFSYLYEESA